jgi:repressor LexA
MVIQPYIVKTLVKGYFMEPLTEKQQKVLRYIEGRLQKDSPPSQREIAQHFGLAQNAVYQLVSYLKKKGYLTDLGGHRGLRLSKAYLDRARRIEGIPILGRVAAGEPILAEENIEGYIDPKELFEPADKTFVLKVIGDSMVDAGIMNGDFVVVRLTTEVGNGQIAVVLLNDEATVKKIYVQRSRIVLEPANKSAAYKTIYVKRDSENVRIIGRVTGCFRKF